MNKRAWPLELDHYSSLIGRDIFMVQGPGGNTSFKDDKTMWVKASGTRLANAVDFEIFTSIDILTGNQSNLESGLRPSIEKDFHLLIPYSFVIHTHSLRALSLAIEKNFGSKANRYPGISFIPYARPGIDLCSAIKTNLNFTIHKAAILQNHGFLTWGNSMEEAYSILRNFELVILDENLLEVSGTKGFVLDHPKAVTPDYAVFLSPNSVEEILAFNGKDIWKKEMFHVVEKAAMLVDPKVGINYLTIDETYNLQNWESEKYRIAANK